jgi:hypothetical protein
LQQAVLVGQSFGLHADDIQVESEGIGKLFRIDHSLSCKVKAYGLA